MNIRLRFFVVTILAVALTSSARPPEEIFPAHFESKEAASKFVSGLFAGGEVDELTVAGTRVMIVSVNGSGRPDLAFGAYIYTGNQWTCAAEVEPETTGVHRAEVHYGSIFIFDAQSHRSQFLLAVPEPKKR
jgi:hypothetical protein